MFPPPPPRQSFSQACNAVGLFSLALNMFDEIYTGSDSDATDPGSPTIKSAISGTPDDLEGNTPEKGENEDADGDVLEGTASGMVESWSQVLGGVEQDGELLPAAAATVALESCFLGGNRDRAMDIVLQVKAGFFEGGQV